MLEEKRILTIDDSAAVRARLEAILAQHGSHVDVAGTGREGLEMCTGGGPYDLVLLDLLLPDMNGIEILKQIRQEDDETAVVILTGAGGVKSAIAAVQHGADGYVEKQDIAVGRDLTQLFYVIERALDHRTGLVAQKKLQEVRADFYSMVTHDLRSPVTSLLTAVHMLFEDDDAKSLSPEQTELLQIMQQSSEKMLSLVNDYLDFAKIDAGYLRLRLDTVELRGIVEDSARLARLQAQARRQTLVLDLSPDPIVARVDAERLGRVLDNLLSNAVKYTRDGGRITVQLRVVDGQAVFRVSDTGIGIAPDQLPALFTKYHRVPGEDTYGIRGPGLGLLIVKEIVEAHGGTVSAESEGVLGKGTTFTARIPLEQRQSL